MLDQHLADVGGGDHGLIAICMSRNVGGSGEYFGLSASAASIMSRARRRRQVGRLELLGGLAELGDFGALVTEEEVEQLKQRVVVADAQRVAVALFWTSTASRVSSKMILSPVARCASCRSPRRGRPLSFASQ